MRLLRILALISAALCAAGAIAIALLDDRSIIALVAQMAGYGQVDKVAGLLGPSRIALLRAAPLGALALLLLVAWRPGVAMAPLAYLRSAVARGLRMVSEAWRGMAAWERAALLVIAVSATALRLWLAATEPAHVDEAMTWLLFTSRGPLVSLSYYAAPNNHILHSLLTNATAWVPVAPLLAMRLPTVLVALAAQASMHLLLRRHAGPAAALIAGGLLMGLFPMVYYGYQSRGYMLTVLAATVAMGALLSATRTGDRAALRALALACAAGLFTMPSFLYPTALFYAYAILARRSRNDAGHRWAVVRSAVVAAALTGLLHAPALAMSGAAAFTSNPWVRPTGIADVMQRWWPHVQSTFEWLTGSPAGIALGMALALAPLLLRATDRIAAQVIPFMVLGSLLIPFVHGVIPFERTWTYLLVPLSLALALSLDRLLQGRWGRSPWALPIAVALFAWTTARSVRSIPSHEYMAYSARAMHEAVKGTAPLRIYCEYVVMGDHLVFELRTRGVEHSIRMNADGSDRAAVIRGDAPTVLLVRAAHPVDDPAYREVYSDTLQRAYVRR